jgi:hypothetical protein
LHYEATAAVGGKIAQIGQRLVDMAAQKMAGEFFQSFNAQLKELYPVATLPEPVEAASYPSHVQSSSGFWQSLRSWFARVFGSTS